MIYYINKQTTVLLYPNPLSCVFTCFSACGRVLWSQVFVKALPSIADLPH